MADNESKTNKDYGLPKVELVPINRDQPGVVKEPPPPVAPKQKTEDSESKLIPIVIFVVFALIAASLLYFFFWDDSSKDNPSQPEVETPVEDRVILEEGEGTTDPGMATPANANDNKSLHAIENQTPGSIITISQRTNRYYIFLGSYKFQAYAKRHAEELAADGFAVKLITPDNWVGMRVAVGNYASMAEANADAEQIKAKYDSEIVISKY